MSIEICSRVQTCYGQGCTIASFFLRLCWIRYKSLRPLRPPSDLKREVGGTLKMESGCVLLVLCSHFIKVYSKNRKSLQPLQPFQEFVEMARKFEDLRFSKFMHFANGPKWGRRVGGSEGLIPCNPGRGYPCRSLAGGGGVCCECFMVQSKWTLPYVGCPFADR